MAIYEVHKSKSKYGTRLYVPTGHSTRVSRFLGRNKFLRLFFLFVSVFFFLKKKMPFQNTRDFPDKGRATIKASYELFRHMWARRFTRRNFWIVARFPRVIKANDLEINPAGPTDLSGPNLPGQTGGLWPVSRNQSLPHTTMPCHIVANLWNRKILFGFFLYFYLFIEVTPHTLPHSKCNHLVSCVQVSIVLT